MPLFPRRKFQAKAADRFPARPDADLAGYPAREGEPTREAVAGGGRAGIGLAELIQVLSHLVDEPERQFGDEITRKMLADPAVAAPIRHLSLALVEHPLTLNTPSRWRLKPFEPLDRIEQEDPERAAHVRRAEEILEFDRRALELLDQPIEDAIMAMGDYPAWGSQLAEVVYQVVDDPILGGMYLGLRAVKPKPRVSWKFVVDRGWNVVGILAETTEGSIVYPPEKFMVLSWWPQGGDPRGTRIVRPAFTAWNAKLRSTPGHVRYIDRFGNPAIIGYTNEVAGDGPRTDGQTAAATGTEDDESPESALLTALLAWANGIALALPHGYQVDLKEATGEGRAILTSLAYWDRQIILGMVSSYRAYLEAEHGSKADSETSQDIVGLIAKAMRRAVARAVTWQVLYQLNVLNFGKAEADLYTPDCSLGSTEGHDLVAEVGSWVSAGWFLADEHYSEIDARLGLTPRGPFEAEEPEPEPEPEPEGEDDDERDDDDTEDEGGGTEDGEDTEGEGDDDETER